MKRYALWGAGNQSLNAQQTMAKLYPDMQAAWLIENKDFGKIGQKVSTRAGDIKLEVITPERFAELYSLHEATAVFVSSGYHVFDVEDISRNLRERNIAQDDILTLPVFVLRKELASLSDADRKLVPLNCLVHLTHLDMHILDYCNIRCKTCAHFSTLAPKGAGFLGKERFRENLKQLQGKIPDIRDIAILGGEPLLHPELGEMLRIAREYFPYATIALVSNGVLLDKMKEDWIQALQDTNTVVGVSLYPPFFKKIDEMIGFFCKNNLRYQIMRVETFEKRLFEKPWLDGKETNKRCGHDMCLRDNRIGRCVMALFTDYFNAAYNEHLPLDVGIDIYGPETGLEIVKKLQDPTELCNYCCSRDHVYEKWEPMKGNGSPDDWMIHLPIEKM